jgi:hypothetical protein
MRMAPFPGFIAAEIEPARQRCRLAGPLAKRFGFWKGECRDGWIQGTATVSALEDPHLQIEGHFERGKLRTASDGALPRIKRGVLVSRQMGDGRLNTNPGWRWLRVEQLEIGEDGQLRARGACKYAAEEVTRNRDWRAGVGRIANREGRSACSGTFSHYAQPENAGFDIGLDLYPPEGAPRPKVIKIGGTPPAKGRDLLPVWGDIHWLREILPTGEAAVYWSDKDRPGAQVLAISRGYLGANILATGEPDANYMKGLEDRSADCRLEPPLSRNYAYWTGQCREGRVHGLASIARRDTPNHQVTAYFDKGRLVESQGASPVIQRLKRGRFDADKQVRDATWILRRFRSEFLSLSEDGEIRLGGSCSVDSAVLGSDPELGIGLKTGQIYRHKGTDVCAVPDGEVVELYGLGGSLRVPEAIHWPERGYEKVGAPPSPVAARAKLVSDCEYRIKDQEELLDELVEMASRPLCRDVNGEWTTDFLYDHNSRPGAYYGTFEADCLDTTIQRVRDEFKDVRRKQDRIRKACRGAGVDVSQMQAEVTRMLDDLEAQHSARVDQLAADMRAIDEAKRQRRAWEKNQHQARLEADFQAWAARSRNSGYQEFLDSIGHDSSASGVTAQARRIVRRHAEAQRRHAKVKTDYSRMVKRLEQMKKSPAPPKAGTRTVELYPETRIDLPNIGVATTGGQSTPPPPGGAGTYTTGPRTIGVRGGNGASEGGVSTGSGKTCFIVQNSISYRGGGSPRVPVGGKEGPFCKVVAYKPLDCQQTAKVKPWRKYVAICESDGPMCGKGTSHLVFPTLKAAQEARPSAYPSAAWGPCK